MASSTVMPALPGLHKQLPTHHLPTTCTYGFLLIRRQRYSGTRIPPLTLHVRPAHGACHHAVPPCHRATAPPATLANMLANVVSMCTCRVAKVRARSPWARPVTSQTAAPAHPSSRTLLCPMAGAGPLLGRWSPEVARRVLVESRAAEEPDTARAVCHTCREGHPVAGLQPRCITYCCPPGEYHVPHAAAQRTFAELEKAHAS